MNCTDKSLEQIMDYHYRCIQPAAFMEAPEMSYLDYVHQKLTRSRTHDSVDGENVFFCDLSVSERCFPPGFGPKQSAETRCGRAGRDRKLSTH